MVAVAATDALADRPLVTVPAAVMLAVAVRVADADVCPTPVAATLALPVRDALPV